MSSNANYFKIGLFVIFSVTIFLVVIMALGIDIITKEKVLIETYVDESVQGLSVGSPVKNRGVQIGRVERIDFVLSEYEADRNSPASKLVLIVIGADPDKLTTKTNGSVIRAVGLQVEGGLRLRLTQQPITGIAYLEADYFDPKKYPAPEIPWIPNNIFIPSVPSMLSNFTNSAEIAIEKFAKLDIESLIGNVNRLVTNLDKVVSDAQVPKLANSAVGLFEELQKSNASLKLFLQELRQTNNNASKLLKPVATGEHSVSIPELVASLDTTLARIDEIMLSYKPDVDETMAAMKSAAGNIKELTEQIKAHPSQVIFSNPPAQTEVYK